MTTLQAAAHPRAYSAAPAPSSSLGSAAGQRRRGFTLLELMLVLTVMVVLAGLAYPSLDAMYGTFRVTAAADAVRAAWAQAKAHAINEGSAYRFSVLPNRGNYRLAPDTPDYWTGGGGQPAPSDPANPPLVLEDALPKGVRFSTADSLQEAANAGGESSQPAGSVDPGAWSSSAVFLPDGTARADVELVFHARGARPLALRLRGLTGAITTRPLAEEQGRP